MADEALLTISLFKDGDGFKARLQAPSNVNGVADLRVDVVGKVGIEALVKCIDGLEALAQGTGQRAEIANRFV